MVQVPAQLEQVNERVLKDEEPEEKVRTLLSWFGAYRRSRWNVASIRDALKKLNLDTWPDFEGVHIDGTVQFIRAPSTKNEAPVKEIVIKPSSAALTIAPGTPSISTVGEVRVDPIHRISRLASAIKAPVRVTPDASLAEAITVMLQNDFSQLPVMTSDRDVKGMISWKSIGSRLALKRTCTAVRDCMDDYHEVSADRSIFDAIRIILENDCVLVRDNKKVISGIVTAADIALKYDQLAGPFLLLGEIENQIRMLIEGKLESGDLKQASQPSIADQQIENVTDLTFGGYVWLLSNPSIWQKIELPIDRKKFVEQLDKVREIRNTVMHFDPDEIEEPEIRLLREFAVFLANLRKLLNR